MRKIILNSKGFLVKADHEFFGGKHGLLERIKLGGVGSTKVIYKNGIPYFDELNDVIENENSYVNFELMKNGFLVLLNRNQRLRSVGFQIHELLKVNLFWELDIEGEAKSTLEIRTLNDNILTFEVLAQQFKSIKKFFEKPVFDDKLIVEFLE